MAKSVVWIASCEHDTFIRMNLIMIIGLFIFMSLVTLMVLIFLVPPHKSSTIRFFQSVYLVVITQKYEKIMEGSPVILITGDSTAYGTGASTKEESIAGRIGVSYPNYSLRNIGVNGDTVSDVVEQLRTLGDDEVFELILLQMGGNDILKFTEQNELEGSIIEAIKIAQEHTDRVVVISSGNVGGASAFAPYGSPSSIRYEQQTRLVRELFMSTTAKHGVLYADVFKEPEDDEFIKEPKKYLALDGLHPTGKGYGQWYQKLAPVLGELLK